MSVNLSVGIHHEERPEVPRVGFIPRDKRVYGDSDRDLAHVRVSPDCTMYFRSLEDLRTWALGIASQADRLMVEHSCSPDDPCEQATYDAGDGQ